MVSAFDAFSVEKPRFLRTVAFGSEVFPPKQLKRWREALPEASFTNLYGPTESTGNFKRIVESIGLPDARFHDLRHSYAVAAIRSGDDIKTVQGNLGHATASFTLDVYGHVTDQMKRESADRMQKYIDSIKRSG